MMNILYHIQITLRTLVLLVFILVFISCNSGSNQETSPGITKKTDTTNITVAFRDTNGNTLAIDTPLYDQGEYALIIKVVEKDTSTYIIADYIQYLKGQPAIDAAIRAHQADTFETEDGKTHIGVQYNYFIANENKKLRRLKLADTCSFDLYINPDNPDEAHAIKDNSLASLKKIYNNSTPFLLTFNKQGLIIKIKQIIVPW